MGSSKLFEAVKKEIISHFSKKQVISRGAAHCILLSCVKKLIESI